MPIAHLPCLLAGIGHMGRPRKRLKADSYDDRKYKTIPVTTNGRTSYPKIHLRTKDDDVARRRRVHPKKGGECEKLLNHLGGIAASQAAMR